MNLRCFPVAKSQVLFHMMRHISLHLFSGRCSTPAPAVLQKTCEKKFHFLKKSQIAFLKGSQVGSQVQVQKSQMNCSFSSDVSRVHLSVDTQEGFRKRLRSRVSQKTSDGLQMEFRRRTSSWLRKIPAGPPEKLGKAEHRN